jgi:pimeloyl-ACP methyl ester carboxylesterase
VSDERGPEGLRIRAEPLANVPDPDLAYQLYYTVMGERRSAAEQGMVDRARRGWLEQGKHRLATYAWGAEAAPVVLFVHGWNGHGSQVAPLVEGLTGAGFQVWAFDGHGHGESTGRTTNVVQLGEVVRAVADRAGDVQGLIGHSLGGMVVSYALQEHGLGAARAVLLATPYSFDHMCERFKLITGVDDEVIQEIVRRSEARTGKRWYDVSGETLIARQRGPALLVHDLEDDQVPIAEGRRIHGEWTGSRLIETRGLGHRRIIADPEVGRQIVQFLAKGV